MSLEPLTDDFLEYLEVEKGRSPLTIREYKHYLERFLNWTKTNSKVTAPAEITPELIRRYRLYLAHLRDQNDKPLKRITQTYHIIALRWDEA